MSRYKRLIFCMIMFILAIFLLINEKNQVDLYKVIFFDISLGDAILIQNNTKGKLLIDTGRNGGEIVEKIRKYIGYMDKKIDILLISHGDKDHIGGTLEIIKQFEVGLVLYNGASKDSQFYHYIINELNKKNIKMIALNKNKDFKIFNDIIFDTIYPFEDISYKKDHSNNDSVVNVINILGNKILFTGDMETKLERKIIRSGEVFNDIDILKVAHHGRKTSSSIQFISLLKKGIYTVAQASLSNIYKHPHKVIQDRYNDQGFDFMQTGKYGDIIFCINSKKKMYLCD